jgi:2-methylcitrate dehydratase PrpD
MNTTERLAEFIIKTEYDQLSEDVIHAAKESFLDFLAVSIAGYHQGDLSKIMIPYLLKIGGREESTILGVEKKVPSVNAALANGVTGHSMDLDDGHRKALGHPGVCVIPAALAVGELTGCSGKTLLTSIVIGYEIFVRIGKAVNPSLFSRGFHTTGICGTLAAASAAAKVLSLDKEKIISTLGIAGTQSSGLLIITHSGQMMKPLNAGKAAQNGVMSALLSQAGALGSSKIVEGKDGFVQAFSGHCDYSLMLDHLGESFEIKKCYKKFYPACRHTHAAIDAALYLKNQFNIIHKDIKEIEVTAYPAALKLTEKKDMPIDEAGTRFNLAFAVSLALIKGRAGIKDFSMENTKSKEINHLFRKVRIKSDPSLESKENNIRGSKVEVVLLDGKKYEKTVNLPKGELENPARPEDFYNKYYECTDGYWSKEKQENVLISIQNLENIENIKTIINLIKE